jgi:predicted MarR family transcription regulator
MSDIREKLDKPTVAVLRVIGQIFPVSRSRIECELMECRDMPEYQARGWTRYALRKLKRLGLIQFTHDVRRSGWALTQTGEDIALEASDE